MANPRNEQILAYRFPRICPSPAFSVAYIPTFSVPLWHAVWTLLLDSQSPILRPIATKEDLAVNTLWQDLRFGTRMLLKQKGITAIAVLSLALGIGANTALFSIVDAMLLKMLPVKEPERLVLFRIMAPLEFNTGGYNGSATRDPVT